MSPKTTLLIGGGHTHVVVLRNWIKSGKPAGLVTLISEGDYQYYSGMLPGVVSGFYEQDECRIDLGELCVQAGVRFIKARVVQLHANLNLITLQTGEQMGFDQLSLDIGSTTRKLGFVEGSHAAKFQGRGLGGTSSWVLPVKPLAQSFAALSELPQEDVVKSLSVIGGGAAGVELALALRFRLNQQGDHRDVNLIVGHKLLSGFSRRVQLLAAKALTDAGIKLYQGHALIDAAGTQKLQKLSLTHQQTRRPSLEGVSERGHLTQGLCLRVSAQQIPATWVLSAAGAAPHNWLGDSSLRLDQGFVAVDQFHRSVSHPHIFAAGDVCARQDLVMDRSGVHAVRSAEALAHNLSSARLKAYRPNRRSLYLISLGKKEAILSYGLISFWGKWVWRLKDWIDRRFI